MKTFLASAVSVLFLGTSFQLGDSSNTTVITAPPAALVPPMAPPAPPVADFGHVSFNDLQEGDFVVVQYWSMGCFHVDRIEFRFHQRSRLMVTAIEIIEDFDTVIQRVVERKGVPLGSLRLSSRDIGDLDRQLAFYRTRPQGDCTTADSVYLTHVSDGKLVAAEGFLDQSCDYPPDGNNEIMTFDRILSLLRKADPRFGTPSKSEWQAPPSIE